MGAATAGAAAGAAFAAAFLGALAGAALATDAELLAALADPVLADPEFVAVELAFFDFPNTPSKKSILFYTTISARAALSLSAVYAGSSFWLHQSLEKYFPYQLWMSVV